VDGCFCDSQATGLHRHQEINIIGFAICALHVHAGKVFAAAKARDAIIMDPDEIEREIFALVPDMKLSIGRLPGGVVDVFF